MSKKKTKYLFISGGVVSSVGKGIASASIGLLLKQRGYSVTIMKFDPYINIDPGTMNPMQHGEVYVTDDGAETDLDLGHYERFLDVSMSKNNNATAGQVYYEVIQRERSGDYLGKTVQVIPHITDEIKRRMTIFDSQFNIVIIEIGGTAGDIESQPFLEAARQICREKGEKNTLNIHLTYVPYIRSAGEVKTKPTQHSVKILMEFGLRPEILLCRTEQPLEKEVRDKIALFCNVDEQSVIDAVDVQTIYEVPLHYAKRNLDTIILKKLGLPVQSLDITTWTNFVDNIKAPKQTVRIGIVGKYVSHVDSYKSISEALIHAGAINETLVEIQWIQSENITDKNVEVTLKDLDGVLVAPGFGDRGIEGKIKSIKYVRENAIPFFGVCLGMQCATIEFARNKCGLKDANSTEFKKVKNNVIDIMDEQRTVVDKGGTMRLGTFPCLIDKSSKSFKAYQKEFIAERHRHRYEFNNAFKQVMEKNGLLIAGTSPNNTLVEIIEIPTHPWFVGVQFHPEYKSRAVSAHPLFIGFVGAALKHKNGIGA